MIITIANLCESQLYDKFGPLNCFLICSLRNVGFMSWYNIIGNHDYFNVYYSNNSNNMWFKIIGDMVMCWSNENITIIPDLNIGEPGVDLADVVWWFFLINFDDTISQRILLDMRCVYE